MNKILLTALSTLLITPLLAVDAASAATRKRTAAAPVDTYYYSGTNLYDLSRPHFGSPVRGYEFFSFIAGRNTQ